MASTSGGNSSNNRPTTTTLSTSRKAERIISTKPPYRIKLAACGLLSCACFVLLAASAVAPQAATVATHSSISTASSSTNKLLQQKEALNVIRVEDSNNISSTTIDGAEQSNRTVAVHLPNNDNKKTVASSNTGTSSLGEKRRKKRLHSKEPRDIGDNTLFSVEQTRNANSPPSSLPSILTLLSNVTRTADIIDDVQFLLDFAIQGFGKCGTTALLRWIQERNPKTYNNKPLGTGTRVKAPGTEGDWLKDGYPADLVKTMYRYAQGEESYRRSGSLLPHEKIFKGYKSPQDIRLRKSRGYMAKYWPKTPLLVTIRHPVHWMVSLYNFNRIEQGNVEGDNLGPETILARGGRNEFGFTKKYVSTAKGEFHAMLAEVGKTPLLEPEELALLQPWFNTSWIARIQQERLPNPILLLESNQLDDNNITRSRQLAKDIEGFLGLPKDHLLPHPSHVRPKGKLANKHAVFGRGSTTPRGGRTQTKVSTSKLKMDICSPEFASLLEEMVAIARSASRWIQDYFIKSPEVRISNPEHMAELLEAWNINPCDTTTT